MELSELIDCNSLVDLNKWRSVNSGSGERGGQQGKEKRYFSPSTRMFRGPRNHLRVSQKIYISVGMCT